MLNNKAILDEAARSVRRTFIGSIAGSLGMLVVVGAAGAYGMPERLTAHALAAAMAKLNMTFPHAAALAAAPADRAVMLAANEAPREPATNPVTHLKRGPVVMSVADDPVVRTMPSVAPPAAVAAPVAPPASPVPAPRETAVAVAAPVADAPPAPPIAQVSAPEPAPAVTSSVPSRPWPDEPAARMTIPAPLVFEEPKLADIKPLAAMPKTDLVAALPAQPKADEPPVVIEIAKPVATPAAPAKPVQQASLAVPAPVEFPEIAWLPMPLAKPPLTPAQRLDLQGKEYDKAEKCLAQAVYFEARNEPARGQMAVAQVVLNRVFSPYYPKDVCSVVYQNAHHFLGCQFTFACDGKPEAIREYGAWARANRIARQALDAKIWLPEVNKATHYHAAYVRPNWIRDMRVMVRYGLHTFYRPRNWGDGSNEPAWGTGAKKPARAS